MKRFIPLIIVVFGVALITAGFFLRTYFITSNVIAPTSPVSEETVTIGVTSLPSHLQSTQFNPVSRAILMNVTEGLVRTDENLSIHPGLAISWGRIDDTTWEFTLRPGVVFHNRQQLTLLDIIASVENAQKQPDSELQSLLSTIKEVKAQDSEHLYIITKVPDPLLLQKLAVTPITPAGNSSSAGTLVGTGPYHLVRVETGQITLERFDKYWEQAPYFKTAIWKALPSVQERVDALEKGDVDLLINVPPAIACSYSQAYAGAAGCKPLVNKNIAITSVPSLEVGFLVFNQNNVFLQSKEIRQAIVKSFDPEKITAMAYGFATPATQFVSSGVFGYNPSLATQNYQPIQAKNLIEKALQGNFNQPAITFDYPQELQGLGEYVQNQLQGLNINVILNPLSDSELQQKIAKEQSDFYFLGWKSELGDAADFLVAVVHTRSTRLGYGQFNGNNYSNSEVDKLIEEGVPQFDTMKRLKAFQQAMLLLRDDAMGVPLYQSETIFAFKKNLQFIPRVDGYVEVSQLKF